MAKTVLSCSMTDHFWIFSVYKGNHPNGLIMGHYTYLFMMFV